MGESGAQSRVMEFIAQHWVSWLIEIVILGTIAHYTISETRKTAEQTRALMAKYDAAISSYAAERTKAIDNAFASGLEQAREKAKSMTPEQAKKWVQAIRTENADEVDPSEEQLP